MQKIYMLTSFFVLLTVIFFGHTKALGQTADTINKKLIVYYFHGTHRCPTCLAIEENTAKVVREDFKKELENGIIEFRIVNFDEEANKPLADDYEIGWSSLFLTRVNGQGEKRENLTDLAFSYGRNNPEKFRRELADTIRVLLEH